MIHSDLPTLHLGAWGLGGARIRTDRLVATVKRRLAATPAAGFQQVPDLEFVSCVVRSLAEDLHVEVEEVVVGDRLTVVAVAGIAPSYDVPALRVWCSCDQLHQGLAALWLHFADLSGIGRERPDPERTAARTRPRLLADLASVLRAAEVDVEEYDGWKSRTRSGSFEPRTVMVHHDASARGYSPAMARMIFSTGRPDLAAPLAQLWLDYRGTWHVGAAGRANHAGTGRAWRAVRADCGNADSLGLEMDLTTGETMPAPMYASLVAGLAGICRGYRWDPVQILGHKEYAPRRKVDPFLDMDRLRRDVGARLATRGGTGGATGGVVTQQGDTGPTKTSLAPELMEAYYAARERQARWIHPAAVKALQVRVGLVNRSVDGKYGPQTAARVRIKQRYYRLDDDGIAGPQTCAKLGI